MFFVSDNLLLPNRSIETKNEVHNFFSNLNLNLTFIYCIMVIFFIGTIYVNNNSNIMVNEVCKFFLVEYISKELKKFEQAQLQISKCGVKMNNT